MARRTADECVFLSRQGRPLTRFGIRALRRPRGRAGPLAGGQGRGAACDPAHRGDAPAVGGCGSRYDSRLARPRPSVDDEHLCRDRCRDQGEGHRPLRRERVRPGCAMVRPERRHAVPPHPVNATRYVARNRVAPLPGKGLRLLRHIAMRCTFAPQHGSWLNIAETELSSLTRECMRGRRIGIWERRAARPGRRPQTWTSGNEAWAGR